MTPSVRVSHRQAAGWRGKAVDGWARDLLAAADGDTLARARVIAVGVNRTALLRLIGEDELSAAAAIATAAGGSAQHLIDAGVRGRPRHPG